MLSPAHSQPPDPTPRRASRFPAALTVLVVGAVLYFARDVLIPISLAVLIAFLLAPLVRRLERHRVPRVIAVGIAMSTTVLGVASVGFLLQGEVLSLAANLPTYKENIRQKLRVLRPSNGGVLDEAGHTIAELQREITRTNDAAEPAREQPVAVSIVDGPTPPLTYARTYLGTFLSRAATAGIVVVFAVFILMRREDLRNRILWLFGERAMHVSTPALDDAARRVSSYLLMQTAANVTTGLAAGIGLAIIGVPSAAVWGLLIALLRYIPYVGVLLGAGLPFALSVAIAPDWSQPVTVIVVVAAVEIVVGNVVEPLLYGSRTGLSPLAILAAAVFWAWLWGPVGLILATPLTVCLAVIGRHVPDLAFLDVLLGDGPALSPPAALYQRLLAGDQEEATGIVKAFLDSKDQAPGGARVFDELLLPALGLAEEDRYRGALTAESERSIHDLLALLIEDVIPAPAAGAAGGAASSVLCVPARDRPDELGARMLAGVLGASGVAAGVVSADALVSEVIERIREESIRVVCISAAPPRAALHARVLAKRIRASFPDLVIVLGVWDPALSAPGAAQPDVGGPGVAVATIRQAAEQIRTLAAPTPAAEPVSHVVVAAARERIVPRPS